MNEAFVTQNKLFRIRVTTYAENPGFVPGAYYVFESARLSSTDWHRIAVFRHDDPVPIPRDQIRFISDKIAYVFMGWVYAVTTDAGTNWSVWEAPGKIQNYRLIQDVELRGTGVGTMRCEVIASRGYETQEFKTDDYGRTWERDTSNPYVGSQAAGASLRVY
ncbi:MAG: hypothetical protein H0U23_06160 [Blastocatellia bacterium]|nr:hypothetical protein [Blastocatellia bacterium]